MKSKYIKPVLVILGIEIRTIEINGIAYVSARGTTDVFSLDWRTQKRLLLERDSAILYGVIDISAPEFSVFASQDSRKKGQHSDREDVIYLRMDRAMMFIAQVSTAHMRAKGNHEGADAILAKRIEFAQALHDYETLGIAINRNHFGAEEMRRKQRLAVVNLIQAKAKTAEKAERRLIDNLIAEAASEIGASYQPDIVDGM